ncbi:HGGxSTG domain-containing protein [Qipengyuania gaetbuli]|uniref:HGGxSTG domain-containing protein n=1 Tax=Qipengyuania gaetbuli TaxID=266952 RepID=UPI0039656CA9
MTRRGTACQCPAIKGRNRCRLHGGRAGAPKGNSNALKHGRYSASTRAIERRLREVLAAGLSGLRGGFRQQKGPPALR